MVIAFLFRKSLSLVWLAVLLSGCQPSAVNVLDGQGATLKDPQGQRWLALNIWAQWCAPCREEIPELNALAQQGSVRVLGYDFDGSRGTELKRKAEAMGIAFAVIEESPLVQLNADLPRVMPTTYIINPAGQLMDTLYGPQTAKGLREHISRLQLQAQASQRDFSSPRSDGSP